MVEHLGVAVRDIDHGVYCVEVYRATCVSRKSLKTLYQESFGKNLPFHGANDRGHDKHSPIPPSGPKSVLAITRTLKSFCTLPMISTAWLSWRCESWRCLSAHLALSTFPFDAEELSYAVQENTDLPTSVDGGLLAAQLPHFAQDADSLVGELLQVGCCDARS